MDNLPFCNPDVVCCVKKSTPLAIIGSQTHAYFRYNITLPLCTDLVIGLFILGFLVPKLYVLVVCTGYV